MAACVTCSASELENYITNTFTHSSNNLVHEILNKAESMGLFEEFHDEIMTELIKNSFCKEMVQQLGDAALEFYGGRQGNTEIERLEMVQDFQKYIQETGFLMQLTQEFINKVINLKLETLQSKLNACAADVIQNEIEKTDVRGQETKDEGAEYDERVEEILQNVDAQEQVPQLCQNESACTCSSYIITETWYQFRTTKYVCKAHRAETSNKLAACDETQVYVDSVKEQFGLVDSVKTLISEKNYGKTSFDSIEKYYDSNDDAEKLVTVKDAEDEEKTIWLSKAQKDESQIYHDSTEKLIDFNAKKQITEEEYRVVDDKSQGQCTSDIEYVNADSVEYQHHSDNVAKEHNTEEDYVGIKYEKQGECKTDEAQVSSDSTEEHLDSNDNAKYQITDKERKLFQVQVNDDSAAELLDSDLILFDNRAKNDGANLGPDTSKEHHDSKDSVQKQITGKDHEDVENKDEDLWLRLAKPGEAQMNADSSEEHLDSGLILADDRIKNDEEKLSTDSSEKNQDSNNNAKDLITEEEHVEMEDKKQDEQLSQDKARLEQVCTDSAGEVYYSNDYFQEQDTIVKESGDVEYRNQDQQLCQTKSDEAQVNSNSVKEHQGTNDNAQKYITNEEHEHVEPSQLLCQDDTLIYASYIITEILCKIYTSYIVEVYGQVTRDEFAEPNKKDKVADEKEIFADTAKEHLDTNDSATKQIIEEKLEDLENQEQSHELCQDKTIKEEDGVDSCKEFDEANDNEKKQIPKECEDKDEEDKNSELCQNDDFSDESCLITEVF